MLSNKMQFRLPRGILAIFYLPLLLVAIAGWGCSARSTDMADDIFLDEAFVTLFPLASSTLIPGPNAYAGSGLADLESTSKKAAEKSTLGPIIASPLVAAGAKGAEGRIVSPFLPASIATASGVHTIVYDFETAYKAIGLRAGKAVAGKIAALKANKNGGKALCAVVFQPNSLRGEEVLNAFREGYEAAATPDSLTIEILESASASVDPAGAADAAVRKALSYKPSALFLALDDSARTILAVKDVAKVVRLGDVSSWGEGPSASAAFEYWLEGNEKAVATTALSLQRSLAAGGTVAIINKVALIKRARFPRIF